MDRPRRKSTSVLNYREEDDASPVNRKSRRSMRKTIVANEKADKSRNLVEPEKPKTRKSISTKKPAIPESSDSEEEDSPIEISDDEKPVASRRSLRKSKSCTALSFTEEESPKKKPKLSSRPRTPSIKALESITTENSPTVHAIESPSAVRRSCRYKTPSKKYDGDFELNSKTRKARRSSESEEIQEDEDDDFTNKENYKKPTDLFEEGVDVEGKAIFGFRTPGKKNAMSEYAANTPKSHKIQDEMTSPKSRRKSLANPTTPKTPKSSRSLLQSLMKTPKFMNSPGRSLDLQKTPHAVRERNRRMLALHKQKVMTQNESDEDFSPSESESSSSESSDSESGKNSTEEESPVKKQSVASRVLKTPTSKKPIQDEPEVEGPRRSQRNKTNYNFVLKSDEYFSSASLKNKTSSHTLDRLKTPLLNHEKLQDLLSKMVVSEEHQKCIQSLNAEHKSLFNKWMVLFEEGYSVLLHGLGSKRNLLQDFHKKKLSDQHVIVVNGYFPDLTAKEILTSIANEILEISSNSGNLHEIIDTIENEMLEYPDLHIFLIIHNLEGSMLRNEKAQNALSRLATLKNIHLIASIDHINTPMLWDHTKLSNYNFSWWDVTTMLSYTEEASFENSLMIENTATLELSSLKHVYASLNSNAKGIYNLIVKHQLQNGNNPNYSGMSFKELYSSCRESFFTSSVVAMRAQLTEFLDHKLARLKRDIAGFEYINIPIKNHLLELFLNEQQ